MVCTQLNSYAQKYLTYVLDIIKMISYKHLKVAIPETIPQNKIVVLGQYVTKLEKVITSLLHHCWVSKPPLVVELLQTRV